MSVVTVQVDGERAGCLVGFQTQTSIHPPRFLVCLSRRNHTYRLAARHRTTVLAVHFLADGDHELAELFGSQTGDHVDKLARCAWHPGPRGSVILDACPNWLVAEVVDRVALGDHVGFALAPVAAHHGELDSRPLTLRDTRDIKPGHEP